MAAGALNPKFTDSFLVKNNNYGDFIRLVRQNVIKYCSDRRPGIVQPVLPPEKKVPELWFHIKLRTATTDSLTLAIRMDNLYLVGFKTPGTAGVWWEFGKQGDTRLITGSNWLGFGGSYLDLLGHQKGLDTVPLGRDEMTRAVDGLAKHSATLMSEYSELDAAATAAGDPYAKPKMMLAKLVIMMSEGLRFLTVSTTVDKKFDSTPAPTITATEGKQVNKWDRISVAVFKWAKDPNETFPDLAAVGVNNKTDAEKIVVLVKDASN
ncbi:hypothetical protein ABZP36_009156 [Zizania latifolia]